MDPQRNQHHSFTLRMGNYFWMTIVFLLWFLQVGNAFRTTVPFVRDQNLPKALHSRSRIAVVNKNSKNNDNVRLSEKNNNSEDDSTCPTSVLVLDYIQDKVNDKEIRKMLPPKPEDVFTLIGDLLSLSIYGFFDHFISQDVMLASVKHADSPAKLSALLAKISPAAQTAVNSDYLLSTPVWVDCTETPYLFHTLQVTVSDQIVTHYSPLLQQTGLAVTALSVCWLLSGYIHHSFAFKHTLSCRTDTALIVTGKTWLTCSVLLFGFTALSHVVCGCPIISFTKGDIDYIVDSLSVLTMWRFMASSMLGTGRDD